MPPSPVDGQVDAGGGHHQHSAPGVQLIPGVPAEKDRHPVHRVASPLVTVGGNKEKIEARQCGQDAAQKDGGVEQPVHSVFQRNLDSF